MSVIDYKGYVKGKYPEPEDRRTRKDFPTVDELCVYGVDIPVPTSLNELRCRYNEKSPVPPLVLSDLEGYKVPPLGLSSVSVIGGGSKQGWIYRAGTFRKDTRTIGKELGRTSAELIMYREEALQEKISNAIADSFIKNGMKIDGRTSADVIAAIARHATDRLLSEDAPVKEVRLWYTDLIKTLGDKDKTVADARERAALGLATIQAGSLDESLAIIREMIAEKKKEKVIDAEEGTFYDVSGETDTSDI